MKYAIAITVALVVIVGAVLYIVKLKRDADAAKEKLLFQNAASEVTNALDSGSLDKAFSAAKAKEAAASAELDALAAKAKSDEKTALTEAPADVDNALHYSGFR